MAQLWEDNIFGKVRNEDWLNVGAQVPTRPTDPMDTLFGDEKTDNLVARWESIASEYQLPVMANFHGFDTEAQTTFRKPIDNHNIEKGLIKVKINQSERLRALMRSGVQGDQKLYDYVMKDGFNLADQVVTRTKVAKAELMATGKVTIKENDLDLTVDYGVPQNHTNFTLDFSANAQKDIPSQIQDIYDFATDKGLSINGFVTSTKMLTKLRKDASLQKLIKGNVGEGTLLRKAELEAFLSDEWGFNQIVVDDLKYVAKWSLNQATGRPVTTAKRYFPENKISFFVTNPGGKMGTGLWGDSPEADAANFENVGKSEVSPYVYIMQWMEKDPTVLWTKASALFMPVLYNPESLFIATEVDGTGA
jgi:hypothetical protein